MKLYEQKPKLKPFGLRSALLHIHEDLFRVHRRIRSWAIYYPYELTPLEKMVIVLEDRRFMTHSGVDLRSIIREMAKALLFRRHGGASTIDMQFVRTATGYKEKTISRKLYEMFLAIIIQYRYSKIMILRSYLSCAYLGSGLIGADRAARKMFGKNADDLNTEQAAFLAAMLVYPRPLLAPALWEARVSRRAKYGMGIYIANKERFDKLVT